MKRTVVMRCVFVVVALAAWFWTQSLIGHRPAPAGVIGDAVHEWTSGLNQSLHDHPQAANALLITSSACIDALGIFLLGATICGPTVRPFLGLLLLFIARELSQLLVSLQPPVGMIWHNPGFPSLLVTYGVATDLFFSGHTALAVYGAIELSRRGREPLKVLAIVLVLFEVVTVLILRAHYTMDVVAGAFAAGVAATVAARIAPACDAALARLTSPKHVG